MKLRAAGSEYRLTTLAPIKWCYAYRWRVGFRTRDRSTDPIEGSGPFTFLDAPYGHFYADPFIVEEKGRVFVFVEDYQFVARSASLACLELSYSGEVLQSRTVLRRPYHLSYPNVFSFNGTYYMIPETAAARRIELYRALEFPWEWTLERVLLDGARFFDPTHAFIGGRHWIFAGASSSGEPGHYDELHLFHGATLQDRFEPHPGNPVKRDVASARPAGRLLCHGNKMIRPAQDCSRWYGCGLAFMHLQGISDSRYSETLAGVLPSYWAPGEHLGIHTFNTSENFEVIDVCSYGVSLSAIAGRARSLLRKRIFRTVPITRIEIVED